MYICYYYYYYSISCCFLWESIFVECVSYRRIIFTWCEFTIFYFFRLLGERWLKFSVSPETVTQLAACAPSIPPSTSVREYEQMRDCFQRVSSFSYSHASAEYTTGACLSLRDSTSQKYVFNLNGCNWILFWEHGGRRRDGDRREGGEDNSWLWWNVMSTGMTLFWKCWNILK